MGSKDEMKTHQQWSQLQQSKEELIYNDTSQPSQNFFDLESVIVECPQNEDCLFGKGRAIMKHPGTLAMHNMLKNKMENWNTSSFKEKNGLTWEVVHEILKGNGRFLQQDPTHGWFVPVEDEVARQKVSISFRDMAKRIRKKSQRQTTKQSQEKANSGLPRKSPSPAHIPMSMRDKDHSLSNGSQPYGASDSEASEGAVCAFLCKGGNGSSGRKGQRGFDTWG